MIKVHSAFSYMQAVIADTSHDDNALQCHEVPRAWMQDFENKLASLAGRSADNKTMYVFTDDDGLMTAMAFYDFTVTYVQWKAECWGEKTPECIYVRHQRATATNLGIPAAIREDPLGEHHRNIH